MEKEVFLIMRTLLLLWYVLLLISCKNNTDKNAEHGANPETNVETITNIRHAAGLEIKQYDGYTVVKVKNAWPGAEKDFMYALVEHGIAPPENTAFDAVVNVPITEMIVTSTTHIPSLEMLDCMDVLVGFPNTDYISSEAARNRIDAGSIQELGRNEDINTELLIDMNPGVVVTFAVQGANSTVGTIQKTGIPVMYNSDWTETTPLGKAEWIKFFGALLKKERQADSIFNHIEMAYFEARKKAKKSQTRPTVLSGAMYKDVWYLPQGQSWAARFIADANGHYLWADSEGTGSHSLNLEGVLEKGEHADVWLGPGQFISLNQMQDAHPVYTHFKAFENQQVYSFTNRKGATGGIVYYELAPNRPDLVLKDIIKILHPELLSEHELFFFSKLK